MARARWADAIDWGVVIALTALGLLSDTPREHYESLAIGFAGLAGAVLGGAALTTWACRHAGERIQGPRKRPAKIPGEAFETTRAMFVAACLLAWPLTKMRLGQPTGLVWSLSDAGMSPTRVILQTLAGVVVLDAWLYWKHRLLHTRWLFPFHRVHHTFRDPTAFASFAVQPVEALLTFWPVLLVALPVAVHWAPLYFGLVGGFVVLNYYLHCGVTFGWIERTVSQTGLNTSAHHNIHHSHANANFGEAMVVWDVICKTRLSDSQNDPTFAGGRAR